MLKKKNKIKKISNLKLVLQLKKIALMDMKLITVKYLKPMENIIMVGVGICLV